MRLSWLKEHFGFTIVIVSSGIGAAIWRGNGLIPTLVAMVVVLAVLSAFGSRRESSSASEGDFKTIETGPFSFNYLWQLSKSPDLLEL